MIVKKYKKKPVVIDAVEYDGSSTCAFEIADWVGHYNASAVYREDGLFVVTLEGEMHVSVGDFVIKGVQNEFYPCKPDVFEATYEAV